MIPGMSTGDIDVNVEVWPSGFTAEEQAFIDDGSVVNMGTLGAVGKIGWFVTPNALEQFPQLATWEGLKDPAVAKAFATADGTLDNNSPSSILASPNNLQEFTDLVMGFVKKPDALEPTQASIKEDITKFLIGKTSNENEKNNPFAINLYLLGYDIDGKLTTLNRAVKENIKTYLNEYRMLTDGVNINDGFVINIGLEFEIIAYNNYNKSEVLTKVINELKDYFNINNWTFNQTINLSEVELLMANVEGVSSVPMLKLTNKCNGSYSNNSYNVDAATKNKIVYPSLDPSVFEIKFPDSDIKGRVK
jgi:hypothetical protein